MMGLSCGMVWVMIGIQRTFVCSRGGLCVVKKYPTQITFRTIHVLKELLEHRARVLVDEAGDALDTASACEAADGRFGDALETGEMPGRSKKQPAIQSKEKSKLWGARIGSAILFVGAVGELPPPSDKCRRASID
jgi:hypothetical protein